MYHCKKGWKQFGELLLPIENGAGCIKKNVHRTIAIKPVAISFGPSQNKIFLSCKQNPGEDKEYSFKVYIVEVYLEHSHTFKPELTNKQ